MLLNSRSGDPLPWGGCRHPARPDNARCDGCPLSETPWWLSTETPIAACDSGEPVFNGAPLADL